MSPRRKTRRDFAALKFSSAAGWRRWLERNHASRKEALLVIFKRSPLNSRFSSRDALEEALCFGWIDGWFKPIDDNRWLGRYTPRRKGSNWSKYNVARAWNLLNEDRMTPAGIAKLPKEVLKLWKERKPNAIIDLRKSDLHPQGITFSDGRDYLGMLKFPQFSP